MSVLVSHRSYMLHVPVCLFPPVSFTELLPTGFTLLYIAYLLDRWHGSYSGEVMMTSGHVIIMSLKTPPSLAK